MQYSIKAQLINQTFSSTTMKTKIRVSPCASPPIAHLFQDTSDCGGRPLLVFHPSTAEVVWCRRFVWRLNIAEIIGLLHVFSVHCTPELCAGSTCNPFKFEHIHTHGVVICLWLRHPCVRAARLQGLWNSGEDGGGYCHHAAEHWR